MMTATMEREVRDMASDCRGKRDVCSGKEGSCENLGKMLCCWRFWKKASYVGLMGNITQKWYREKYST